jgi:hypothetical protein
MNTEPDMTDDEKYLAWIESLADDCLRDDGPCPGCMAGGVCDGHLTGNQ